MHHEGYLKGCEPWDYPNEYYTTLCNVCHDTLHLAQKKGEFVEELYEYFRDNMRRYRMTLNEGEIPVSVRNNMNKLAKSNK